MTKYNVAILAAAGGHLGLEEWPGARHNPAVVQLFEDVGHSWVQDDETAWCAAFVGSVLASLGLPHTGALNARSYLEWGEEVAIQDAQPGDVAVFWRGSRSSWQGHVAFFVRFEGGRVVVRGGNQGNKVSDQAYPMDRLLAIRRATGAAPAGSRPVLRSGDRGAFVLDLQKQLADVGYPLGRLDGVFGTRTRAAVLALQADAGLTADGLVGAKTWEALRNVAKRPARDVDEADLRQRGSKTIKHADGAQAGSAVAVAVGAGTVAIQQAEEVVAVVDRAQGLLGTAGGLLGALWPVLLLGALGLAVWWLIAQVKAARVEDARSGRNLGR